MALTITCGPAGSGKTERAMRAYLEASDRGDNPVFIAPSGPDARHFQRELLRLRGALTGKRVMTLGDLAGDVFRRAGFDTRVIGSIERRLLLRSVIADTGSLSFLRPSSRFPGFIDALIRLIGELEAACISPEQLAEKAKGILRDGLNSDLYRIYSGYQDALRQQQVVDAELAQCQAVESMAADPSLLRYGVIVMDGFSDLTPIQHSLVDVLAEAAGELLILIPCEEGNPATDSVGRSFREFLERVDCNHLDPPVDDRRQAALVHLDRQLFGDSAGRITGNGAVRLLQGAGPRGEAALVAAEVLRLHRQGEPLDGMAVICRSLGSAAAAFERAFREAGIPCELNAPLELDRTPLGSTLRSLLGFIAIWEAAATAAVPGAGDGGARRNLLAYLRSSLPAADDFQVDLFARHIGLHCIDGAAELLAAWERLGGGRLEEFDTLRMAAAKGVSELGTAVMALATRLVSGRIAASDRLGAGDPGGTESDLLALEMVRQACSEADRIGGDARGTAGNIQLLDSGLASASAFPPSARLRDCVRILDPHRVLNQQFDTVFITGMLEGQFPVLGGEDPFISDSERARLREGGLDLEQKADRLAEERFLFHRTISRARNKLYLSYPYCSSEGKEQVRSLFVDEVLELVDIAAEHRRTLRISDVAFAPDQAATRSQALRSLCLAAGERLGRDGSLSGDDRTRLKQAAAGAGLAEPLDYSIEAGQWRPVVIASAEVREELEGRTDFHASELESYGKCGFRFLVERLMQPATMELDEFNREQGTVAHRVLQRLIGETKSHVDISQADEAQLLALRGKLDQLIDGAIAERGFSDCVDGRLMAFTLKRHLGYFIARESEASPAFKPDSLEFPFSEVDMGDGLTLSGRIDRIDRIPGSERALVIDYKTGSSVSKWRRYEHEQQLQVPLYVHALSMSGIKPVGGEYYALLSGERRGFYLKDTKQELGRKVKPGDLVTEEQFETIVAAALERARALARGIRSLDFQAGADERTCKYCGFSSICRRLDSDREAADD